MYHEPLAEPLRRDATRTHGELYGPLTCLRPVAMYSALCLSLAGAIWLGPDVQRKVRPRMPTHMKEVPCQPPEPMPHNARP